jgi:hydrogenase nickel incorporation protein HypB
MCSTCGCSGDENEIRLTEIDANGSSVARASSRTHEFEPESRPPAGGEHRHYNSDGSVTVHSHSHHDLSHSLEHPHPHADSGGRTIRLDLEILAKNNTLAERNREWLEARDIVAINLMSTAGSGKTTLLERTIRDLHAEMTILVVEGDQATTRDADRIGRAGARVVQINTGSGCHLDASMIAEALRRLDPPAGSLLLIENVGNLVCPALFDLGERARLVLTSVTEGEDKPLKYPHMFRAADLMILNKTDLLPHLSFDVSQCVENAFAINSRLKVLQLSALSGVGLESWYSWLREQRRMLAAHIRIRN